MPKKKVFQIGKSLTEGLKETVNVAHSYMGELLVEVIPLSKMELDADNPRELLLGLEDIWQGIKGEEPLAIKKLAERESLDSLVKSIKEQGVLNPIIVYKHAEKYRLIAGERRTLASALAGKESIQAKVFDKRPTELKLSLLQWIENMERKDLTLWERLRNIEKIVEAYCREKQLEITDIPLSNLSDLLGCAKTQAKNYKDVLKADHEIKSLIKSNQIANLEKAAVLANIKSEESKKLGISACLNGASVSQLKEMLQNLESVKPTPIKNEGRGRRAEHVQLGATKCIKSVQYLMDILLKDPLMYPMKERMSDVDWQDFREVSQHFQQILRFLERQV